MIPSFIKWRRGVIFTALTAIAVFATLLSNQIILNDGMISVPKSYKPSPKQETSSCCGMSNNTTITRNEVNTHDKNFTQHKEEQEEGSPPVMTIVPPQNNDNAPTPPPLIRRFSENTMLNIERGLNIINCWSGHQMAAWVYEGIKPINRKYRTWGGEPSEKLIFGAEFAGNLTENDTIFVSYAKIDEFTMDFLPHIHTPFVLITTPFHILYPTGLEQVAKNITSHDYLLHWFATNIGNYTGGYQFHPKVSPFPLGLKPKMGSRDFQNPIPIYREIFLNTTTTLMRNQTKNDKENAIFAGYISRTNTKRKEIPSGPKLPYADYLKEIAKASYVISPDGDHPDCHRHYESLGLGSVPITQLDPYLYSHLKEGPVIYNNTNWNLTELEKSLPIPALNVNRNMVFEEYWMEYIEGVVGFSLRWWDVVKRKRLKLQDF